MFLTILNFHDWHTWVSDAAGSKRGIKKILSSLIYMRETNSKWQAPFPFVASAVEIRMTSACTHYLPKFSIQFWGCERPATLRVHLTNIGLKTTCSKTLVRVHINFLSQHCMWMPRSPCSTLFTNTITKYGLWMLVFATNWHIIWLTIKGTF